MRKCVSFVPPVVGICREAPQGNGGGRTVIEPAAQSDSKSNGLAEGAVHSVEEMGRVHKLALERRTGVQLGIFAWLVEQCVDVLNTGSGPRWQNWLAASSRPCVSWHDAPVRNTGLVSGCG